MKKFKEIIIPIEIRELSEPEEIPVTNLLKHIAQHVTNVLKPLEEHVAEVLIKHLVAVVQPKAIRHLPEVVGLIVDHQEAIPAEAVVVFHQDDLLQEVVIQVVADQAQEVTGAVEDNFGIVL